VKRAATEQSSLVVVARPVGVVTLGLAFGMLLCAAFGVGMDVLELHRKAIDPGAWKPMLAAALITAVCGGAISIVGRDARPPRRRRRAAVLAVALIWAASSVFGALPYVLGAKIAPIDAVFEAVSGFTTTGATIVEDIEGTLSSPVLLWRSLTQWLGGMGIVVLFVAVFPNLGVGAKEMFKHEVPGPTSEGLRPRIAETSIMLWKLYTAFTVAQILVMWLALRIDLFDAVCHAFTTLSTGGFSTYDASAAGFDSYAAEMVLAVFMIAAGVNFAIYYSIVRGQVRSAWRSTELRVYLALVAGATVLLTVGLLPIHHTLVESFRRAFFMVATTITSTGYGTDSYMAYPPPALWIVLALMFIGGSAGSTAGGIKVSRVALMLEVAIAQTRQTLRPSLVQTIRIDGRPVPSAVLVGVSSFCVVYFACLAAFSLIITYTDNVPVQTAFGAILTSLSNMGPAPFHLGADNFAGYTDAAKLLSSFAMVLGRLEFFTLLALLTPDFWRK
jgi:trk system potassium uptake protein TrkH